MPPYSLFWEPQGGHNLTHLVEIWLTGMPKSGGGCAPPAPTVPPSLLLGYWLHLVASSYDQLRYNHSPEGLWNRSIKSSISFSLEFLTQNRWHQPPYSLFRGTQGGETQG